MEETYFYKFELDTIGILWGFDDYSHLFVDDNNVVYLKPIYLLPFPNFPDSHAFKHKVINGQQYINLLYSKTQSGYRINNSRWIKDYLVSHGAKEASTLFHDRFSSNFFAIERNQIIQQISPRESAQTIVSYNQDICQILRELSDLFNIPSEQLGITGSLSLGAKSYQDIDIVVYGTTTEISRIKEIIRKQQEQYGAIIENGKEWPCRFRDKHNNIICCFFNYTDQSYTYLCSKLLSIIDAHQISSYFEETIVDDTFSFSKTPIYQLSGIQYDFLLVLSRESRGWFCKGDRITGRSIWGYTSDRKKILIVFNPYKEIMCFRKD